MNIAYPIVLALDVLWFGAGFVYFALTPNSAAKIVTPKSARTSPLFETLAASLRFLGGMNFALSAFAVLLLATNALFPDPRQRAIFATLFAMAHASQFIANLPVAIGGGRRGESLWPVLRGTMLFIFTVDGLLAAANGVLAAALLAR